MPNTIGSVSGQEIDFGNPNPSTLKLGDIVTGLSHVCRFAGQIEVHYSVGQHSVNVAKTVWNQTADRDKALQGLLHDASEAYTGDVPKPLKWEIGDAFKVVEDRLQRCIYQKFGVAVDMYPEVKEADRRWLITERDQLQPNHYEWGSYRDVVPYHDYITVWNPGMTTMQFYWWFNFLNRGRQNG